MPTHQTLNSEVVISWDQKLDKRYLKFTFHGDFTETEAEPALQKWEEEFRSNVASGEKVDLIWNCLEMAKYSAKAAKIWKSAMSEMNPKIAQIWLVSTNTFIRMGARTVTFLLPLKLKVISSEDEIK